MKNLKSRLKNGETLLGCWLNLGNSLTAEIVGLAGFDWVLIDLEHGSGTQADLLYQLQALEHTSAAPVVRVENYDRQRIHRVLDAGAEGVMCPRIYNYAEAQRVVSGLRYPPHGYRGVAKMVRATGYGENFETYRKEEKNDILGIVQIETLEVLEYLSEIAALDGVDVLFIGPCDLSIELGIFDQFNHPLFIETVNKVISAARDAGKATGILLFNPDDFKVYHDMGMRFFASGSDASFVAHGARNMFSKLNSYRSEHTK